MNRMNEYQAMIKELEQPSDRLETTLDRAYKKRRKRTAKMIIRPLSGLAACFAIFVMLVNFCAPVAYACSQIPILRELAEAVTFSKSLTAAVENEYVQTMDLSQTENDITVEVDYLIVDRKQVNVFFRLQSDCYTNLEADVEVLNADGTGAMCAYGMEYGIEDSELQHLDIDFIDMDVPSSLIIQFKVYSDDTDYTMEYPEDYLFEDDETDIPNYLAEFEFLLEFDPEFTSSGKVLPINQTVMLDGQEITITNVEIYPTYLSVNIEESDDNTAWLVDLDFYIEADRSLKFETVSNGITAVGSEDSPSNVSYMTDSTYFYEASRLELVITGAKWLSKDKESTYINMATGEIGELPEGVEFVSAKREGNGWVLNFRAKNYEDECKFEQLFMSDYYDADGNAYEINTWEHHYEEMDEDGKCSHYLVRIPLENYTYDEAWLCPQYSHIWAAEDTIIITVQ